MPRAPNLFDFAPSELSQDAFLCWLIAHADYDEKPAMKAAAQAFIAALWNAAHPERTAPPSSVQLVKGPLRQVEKIDIFFEAKIGDTATVFLIEDKTDTSHHSNQLARYREVLEGTHRAHELVLIYLKTGFHFDSDETAREHGYTVIGLREILACLQAQAVDSEIFQQFIDRGSRLLAERDTAIAALRSAQGHEQLKSDFVQYTFMRDLASRCIDTIGGMRINRGRSIGGAPWTHYRFATFPGTYAGVGESLFHRIDARVAEDQGRRAYLSTRQYAVVKDAPDARRVKVARLGRLRELFELAKNQSGTSLEFSTPTKDTRGANESEIAVLFFDDGANSIEHVLEEMPPIHAAFVALLKATELPCVPI